MEGAAMHINWTRSHISKIATNPTKDQIESFFMHWIGIKFSNLLLTSKIQTTIAVHNGKVNSEICTGNWIILSPGIQRLKQARNMQSILDPPPSSDPTHL